VKSLEDLGAIVDDIAIYKTVPETEDLTGAAGKFQTEGADWLTFMSSSSVQHFHERFDLPKLQKQFPKMKIATIGPETTKALATLGLKPKAEAKPHTLEGLVDALS
jgi:uroporphyrinogen III methyltransferase/synthase